MGSRFREIADREVTHPDVPDPARPVEGLESLHRLPQGDLAPRIRPMHLVEGAFPDSDALQTSGTRFLHVIRPPRGRRIAEAKTYRGVRSNHSGAWSGRRKRRNDLLYLSCNRSDSEIPFRYAFSNADQSFDSMAAAIDPNVSRTNAAMSSAYFGRATEAVFRIFSDSFIM